VGWKLVAADEEHFHGHFPGNPLMPGVLQLEAMAQVAGALLLKLKQYHGKISVIVSIDKVRFRRPVLPGDRLRIEAEAQIVKDRTAQVSARTTVEGERAAEARFRFMLVEDDKEAR
jgi:3-hydroxyacyl-[acyl-carrier-protein] dehydratase